MRMETYSAAEDMPLAQSEWDEILDLQPSERMERLRLVRRDAQLGCFSISRSNWDVPTVKTLGETILGRTFGLILTNSLERDPQRICRNFREYRENVCMDILGEHYVPGMSRLLAFALIERNLDEVDDDLYAYLRQRVIDLASEREATSIQ